MPASKEMHFFDRQENFSRGLGWYGDHFREAGDGQVIGECSPPYLHAGITVGRSGEHVYAPADDSMHRIKEALPRVKLVFTLRHPADRAYSQYWKNRIQGSEKAASFEAAVEEELQGKRAPEAGVGCWLYKNRYALHLRRWLELFPRERFFFMIFEEWTASLPAAQRHLLDLHGFLGVPPLPPEGGHLLHVNRGSGLSAVKRLLRTIGERSPALGRRLGRGYPPMSEELRRRLCRHFADDITVLEGLVGRDLSIWRRD